MSFRKKPIYLIIGLVCVILILSALVIRSKSFQFFGGIVYQVQTNEKVIALTFDDGPSDTYTDEILSILNQEEVKATFFLVGEAIKNNPQSVNNIIEAGHEVGNHSYTHSRMIFKTIEFIRDEIERTDKLIRQTGYEKTIWFRPPYGQTFLALPWYLKINNRPTIMYDIQVENFRFKRTNDEMVQYTLENTKPGSIIVFHVMTKEREQERIALPIIIKQLKTQGYRFVTVSELLVLKEKEDI